MLNVNRMIALGLVLGGSLAGPLEAQSAAAPGRELLGVPVASARTPLEVAVEEFKATGRARTLPPARPGDFTAFPFGHARAFLRCAALKLCQVELQPGEALTDDPLPGDRERWDVDRTVSGGTTVVLVKPNECDVSTNLIIPTDRRRYVVDLEVPPCRGTNPRGEYMAGIRFWYPDEALHPEREPGALDGMIVDLRNVNTDYRWQRSGRIAWTPARIFDDGKRTYIQFAPVARDGEMPVLYAVADDGTRELVNSVPRPDSAGDYLIADRVLKRGVLVLRDGKRERKLDLVNMVLHRRGR
jgi:type IV secretion system protein VirB9